MSRAPRTTGRSRSVPRAGAPAVDAVVDGQPVRLVALATPHGTVQVARTLRKRDQARAAIVRAMRLDSFLLALSTFFATIGPADLVLVFAALTERMTTKVEKFQCGTAHQIYI